MSTGQARPMTPDADPGADASRASTGMTDRCGPGPRPSRPRRSDAAGRDHDGGAPGGVERSTRAAVGEQVAEVQASRRRLVDAGDAERQALEARLHDGAEPQLEALAATIAQCPGDGGSERPIGTSVRPARGHPGRADASLPLGCTRGSCPSVGSQGRWKTWPLGRPCQPQCACRLPTSCQTTSRRRCTSCAARPSRTRSSTRPRRTSRSRFSVDGGVASAIVTDDGTGGADPAAGTGLSGLRDRIEALGGTLVIASPAGAGTRLVGRAARLRLGATIRTPGAHAPCHGTTRLRLDRVSQRQLRPRRPRSPRPPRPTLGGRPGPWDPRLRPRTAAPRRRP